MSEKKPFEWAVLGAGPAGIAAVGKLLDAGISNKEILWIDPHFSVGDFGTLWRQVPSNTKASLFLKFLHSCDSFNYRHCDQPFEINKWPPNETCQLYYAAEPLQWISNHLKDSVHGVFDMAKHLSLSERHWHIATHHEKYQAKNVILAIGALPKTLTYHSEQIIIPLEKAMDKNQLKNCFDRHDVIAVFGSSHSALLALRNCVELSASKIINFYRSPLVYAVPLEDWIMFDDTGLKGTTAQWARENIDGKLPPNLIRVIANTENTEHFLPQCSKVIYAVGFERRHLPVIEGLGQMTYHDTTGIIAPGLFGFGIAFPEKKANPLGFCEYRVGLWKFMDYLNTILPIWLKYST